MFQPTKPHKSEAAVDQQRLRIGSRVPNDAVSLAYMYSSPLNPSENIQIADLSGFVLENITDHSISDTDLWPNDQGLLTTWDGEPYIGSRSFSLTNEFIDHNPLYYVHELGNRILDTSGKQGYVNNGISIVDARGNALPKGHLYKIVAIATDEPNVYKVRVFTNFQKQPSETVKAIYTAYKDGRIIPGYSEQLNPYHAFIKSNDLVNVSIEPGKTLSYYQGYGKDIGQSQVYVGIVPIKELDWRKQVPFRYRVIALAEKGAVSKSITTPWIYDTLLSSKSISEADMEYYNGFKRLAGQPVREIVREFGDMALFDDPNASTYYTVETLEDHVTIHTDGSGDDFVLASTDIDSSPLILPASFRTQYRAVNYPFEVNVQVDGGTPQVIKSTVNILEGHKLIAGPYTGNRIDITMVRPYDPITIYVRGNYLYAYTQETETYYVPRFSMQTSNNRQIRVLNPAEKYAKENWYLRVKNGQFTRTSAAGMGFNITHFYSVPEYYRQDFNAEYGMPIRKVVDDEAEIAGDRKIRVRYAPLYIRQDKVTQDFNLEVFVNGIKATVKGWLIDEGIIEIDMKLKETDSVSVSYFYEELAFTYRGYWDEKSKLFWNLDLNPGVGHTYTGIDAETGEIVNKSTFELINKTVYLYLKPTAKFSENKEMVRGSYTAHALYHTFQEVNEPNHVLLGKILVRPNSSYENMKIIDTRKRGGGLKENIREELMRAVEPESQSYWDIGYWDGEPFSENGVVIVRLPLYILKEQGGQLTKDQVEQMVKRHIGFGNLPVIEYIDEPRRLLESPQNITINEEE